MKAITCSQCGALIKRISLRDKFALCDYCVAKIIFEENKERIVEISDKKENEDENQLTPSEQYRENYRKINERTKQYDAPYTYPQEPENKNNPILGMLFLFFIIGGVIIAVALNFDSCLSRPLDTKEKTPLKTYTTPTIEYPTSTPVPRINYEVK
jgi:DNA-directed RNA polymerase subunit RPC12/RpoP